MAFLSNLLPHLYYESFATTIENNIGKNSSKELSPPPSIILEFYLFIITHIETSFASKGLPPEFDNLPQTHPIGILTALEHQPPLTTPNFLIMISF